MPKWIPLVALFGLCCLMIIPAPGIEGLVIGSICVLVIIGSATMFVLDRLANRILQFVGTMKKSVRRQSRAVHAGSGMAKKVPTRR